MNEFIDRDRMHVVTGGISGSGITLPQYLEKFVSKMQEATGLEIAPVGQCRIRNPEAEDGCLIQDFLVSGFGLTPGSDPVMLFGFNICAREPGDPFEPTMFAKIANDFRSEANKRLAAAKAPL